MPYLSISQKNERFCVPLRPTTNPSPLSRFGPLPQKPAWAVSSARSAAGGWLACCPPPARSARLLRSSSSRASSKLLRAANRQSRRSHLRRCKTPRPPSSIDVVPSRAVRAARRASSRAARPISRGHDVGIPSTPAALVCVGARTTHLCYNGRRWFIGRDYGTAFCRPCSCRCRNQRHHLESRSLLDLFPLLYDHVMILSLPARRILMMRQVY